MSWRATIVRVIAVKKKDVRTSTTGISSAQDDHNYCRRRPLRTKLSQGAKMGAVGMFTAGYNNDSCRNNCYKGQPSRGVEGNQDGHGGQLL